MKNIAALLFFLVVTIIATYPLPQHMADTLVEPGDSLLNTWIISWDIKKLTTDPINLFHANIFYPYKYTLAYTEHMLGNALLAMPVSFLTNNPILSYNFVLLATFVIGGWGMFLLIRYLTKSSLAGIIGGVIFVFNPFRFYALGHLHVLSIHWLPFGLLFLHKYFDSRKNKDLFLFGTFFILQAITSGHIGLYQNFVVGMFLFFILISRENIWGKHWLKLGFVFAGALIILLPLYLPYIHLAKELNFVRQEGELKIFSATFKDFRGIMYPGMLAFILAILGIFHKRSIKTKRPRYIIRPLNICILIVSAVILYFFIYGRFDLGYTAFGVKLKVNNLENPFFILLGLLVLKLFLEKKTYFSARFYFILAIASFLFCFGPEIKLKETFTGPYMLLFNCFPGFKGVRVPSRWAVIFMLAVGVLAGLGWKKIEKWNWTKWTVFPVILVVLLYSYISTPLILRFSIWEKPPVYEWLAQKQDESAVIELPMPDWYSNFHHEAVYMYWSLYHNKRMINGYSGYSPPTYWPTVELMRSFPSRDSIYLLQYLDIKYIVIHNGIEEERFSVFKKDLALSYKNGNDYVYELISGFIPKEEQIVSHKNVLDNIILEGAASHNEDKVKYAYDNNIDTRWDTGHLQTPGMWFLLDLGKVVNLARISLCLGRSPDDYPRGVKLEVSEDSIDWREVELELCYPKFIIDLMKDASNRKFNLDFNPTEARYIRISVTEEHIMFYWSIHEIEIYSL